MKILVVEDNFPSRELVRTLLELEGYDVKAASDGKEGLELYDKYKPDLIVSDIEMPNMDGLSLLRNLREKKSDVFFIITTAYGSEDYAMEAIRNGANNYLKKPIDTQLLLRIVDKYKSIIRNRKLARKAAGKITHKFVKTQFLTNYNHIPMIVAQLISEISAPIADSEKNNIEMGLSELITNSIEHGNLEITYEEKIEASNSNTLQSLYEQRMENAVFSKRTVSVDYKQDIDYLEWIITDEGKGFKWQDIPDPTENSKLSELSGRGIFLSGFYFDEMEYSGKGNVVRIKKILKK